MRTAAQAVADQGVAAVVAAGALDDRAGLVDHAADGIDNCGGGQLGTILRAARRASWERYFVRRDGGRYVSRNAVKWFSRGTVLAGRMELPRRVIFESGADREGWTHDCWSR